MDAFELCYWRRLLSPLDCKEIKPFNPKGNQPWIYIGRADAKAEAPKFWPPGVKSRLIRKDPDAEKDWRQKEKGATENEMAGWHHWLSAHEFEQAPGDSEGQGSLMCCSSWGHKGSDMTSQLNNNKPIQVQTQWPSRFLDMGLQGTLKEWFSCSEVSSILGHYYLKHVAAKAPGKVKGKDDFKDESNFHSPCLCATGYTSVPWSSAELQGLLGNIGQDVFGKKKQGGGHTALSMPQPLDFAKFCMTSNKSRYISGRTRQDFCSILGHIIITAGIRGNSLSPFET